MLANFHNYSNAARNPTYPTTVEIHSQIPPAMPLHTTSVRQLVDRPYPTNFVPAPEVAPMAKPGSAQKFAFEPAQAFVFGWVERPLPPQPPPAPSPPHKTVCPNRFASKNLSFD